MTTPVYRKREYLSISTLIDFARCPRRYFYRKCGLESFDEALAPIFGSAMHKAVPVALMTGSIDLALDAFRQVWTLENECSGATTKWNIRGAERALVHFIHTHNGSKSLYKLTPPPAGSLEVDDKVSDYEVPWAIDIGVPIPLVGRIDAFCTHRDTGEDWAWEFKTTGRMNQQFFDQFDMNPQVLTYALVGRTFFGRDIKGVMIEGMLTDPKKVDNQTYPVLVMHHHLENILTWLRFKSLQLLEAEAKYAEIGAEAFIKDFCGCTPYTHFYMPGYRCEFAELCRVQDWTTLTDFFHIKPEFKFTDITKDSNVLQPTNHPSDFVSSTSNP